MWARSHGRGGPATARPESDAPRRPRLSVAWRPRLSVAWRRALSLRCRLRAGVGQRVTSCSLTAAFGTIHRDCSCEPTGDIQLELRQVDPLDLADENGRRRLAVGETVILLHLPLPVARSFNVDGEGLSVEWQSRRRLAAPATWTSGRPAPNTSANTSEPFRADSRESRRRGGGGGGP